MDVDRSVPLGIFSMLTGSFRLLYTEMRNMMICILRDQMPSWAKTPPEEERPWYSATTLADSGLRNVKLEALSQEFEELCGATL